MELLFIATLLISIAGLVSLFSIKRWELETGRMVLAGARPKINAFARTVVAWFERALPGLLSSSGTRAAKRAEEWLHRAAAHMLLATEQGLEHMLRHLRGVTEQPRTNREASEFLREVAAHKRTLLSKKASKRKAQVSEVEEG
ncbi:MAG TPA: hypothetical protein VG984_00345 [Candidatus Paceibacterota bacterium]|nr:hypothetical protein [Candidatus Paceibacterota bacterium]